MAEQTITKEELWILCKRKKNPNDALKKKTLMLEMHVLNSLMPFSKHII